MKHEFRELKIWQIARDLNTKLYSISDSFPKEERYGLQSQLRRASISIASNIAEGSVYDSNSMFLKSLYISLGSLCEVETQLYLANDIKYINENKLLNILRDTDKLKRMIISFMKTLRK